jgi:hypothetical protein
MRWIRAVSLAALSSPCYSWWLRMALMLETMTPPSMGGDCNLEVANRMVGDQLLIIGGFDQQRGFASACKQWTY